MKTLAISIAALCLAGSAAASLKSEIEAMNVQLSKAFLKRDMAMFNRITSSSVTKDFKYTEEGRTMNYEQMLAEMKMGFSNFKSITVSKTVVVACSEKGNTGSAKSRHRMAGEMMGPDKKPHKFTYTGVSNDTFRKEGGKWKIATMNWTETKMTMDGKPFDPMKAGGGR